MSTTATPAERARQNHDHEAALRMVESKIGHRAAGLDPYDMQVLIVEVQDPFRRHQLSLLGHIDGVHPHVQPGGERCFRIRVHVRDKLIRARLGLDGPGAPVLLDEPLASRMVRTAGARADIDARRGERTRHLRRVQ